MIFYSPVTTFALTNTVHTVYDSLGNVVSVWGAAYPVEQGYDTQGRKVSMKTFRDEEGAGDETRWLYDHATGLLTNKVYAGGKGTAYTYTPDGKLATRAWARGVETAYSYNAFGSLVGVDYSDSTPDVTYAYDRLERMVSATSTVATNLFAYDGLNLATETQNGVTINRATDSLGRQAGFGLGTDYAVQYGYDEFGCFTAITSSVLSVSSVTAYSRLDGSGLIASMTNSAGFFWSRTYEQQRNLIASVENRFGANLISQFDYTNDELGRRMQRVDDSAVTNNFGYNPRSELATALMGTNQYGYAYDPIGNRTAATNNAEGWTYLSNPLNQYTNIADGAILEPEYDLDGNMLATGDGWSYVWDGENRLILASNNTTVVTYAYDHQGRMVSKGINGSPRQYLWDGYNIVQETIANQQSAITNAYVWGLDLSGTLQGAGGVGGLLAEIQDREPYFAAFDANGNVTGYISTNGITVADYEYSPFGENVTQSKDLADSFTHRFSTKPWCGVTGLSEYEKRKYEPTLGRWRSRDPIGEMGGLNIVGFVGNSAITHVDALGEKAMVLLVDTKYYSHTMEDQASAEEHIRTSQANMDAFAQQLEKVPTEAIAAALKDGRFTLNGTVETSMTYEQLRSLIERERTSSVTVLGGSYGTDISAIEVAVKALDKPYDEVAVAVHGVWYESDPKPSHLVAWGADLVSRADVFPPLLKALAGKKAIINSCYRTWTPDQKNNRDQSAETLLFSTRQASDRNPAYGGVKAKFLNGKLEGPCWIVFRTAHIGKKVGTKVLKGNERYEQQ